MADHTIRITLTGSLLSFTDDTTGLPAVAKRVSPNDKLRWICNEGPFFVLFAGNKSPATPKLLALCGEAGGFSKKIKMKKLGFAGTGVFKYAAGVMGGGGLVDVDPDVILDDPGGGSGGRRKRATKKKAKKNK